MPEPTRYEIKMVTEQLMLQQVRSWLQIHPVAFYRAYSGRQVNNIYFDTPLLDSFVENLAGGAVRRKVRLRWYGEDTTNVQGVFEVKCKRNMHGWKMSQHLSKPLDLSNLKWSELMATIREELTDDLRVYLDSSGTPALINRYQREYYVSFDKTVRVTLDYSLIVYNQRYAALPNLSFPIPPSDDIIIEFKASTEHRERLGEVIADIPLRVSKYSKYALGIQALLGY